MFEESLIRKTLCDCIQEGNKKFVIYPFGKNGILVKNILQDYFNIVPRLVVDNTYSKYNSKLINFDRLKEEIQTDDYVILTIENKKINDEMSQELKEIHDKNRIINLYDISKKNYKTFFSKSYNEI